jgi:hypothetical protein
MKKIVTAKSSVRKYPKVEATPLGKYMFMSICSTRRIVRDIA